MAITNEDFIPGDGFREDIILPPSATNLENDPVHKLTVLIKAQLQLFCDSESCWFFGDTASLRRDWDIDLPDGFPVDMMYEKLRNRRILDQLRSYGDLYENSRMIELFQKLYDKWVITYDAMIDILVEQMKAVLATSSINNGHETFDFQIGLVCGKEVKRILEENWIRPKKDESLFDWISPEITLY